MIRIKYKQHLDDKSFREKQKITLDDVVRDTDISKATLTRLANMPGYNFKADTLDKLCKYFNATPGELLEYIEDDEA